MEQTRTLPQALRRREQPELPLPEAAETPAPVEPEAGGGVQVISGASLQAFPLAGLRIVEARNLVSAMLNLDPESPVLVNGEPVSPEHRLRDGDVLEFVHHAGEKGVGDGPAD